MKHHVVRLVAGILLFFAAFTATSSATPVTVLVRIEGATATIYEGAITTDVRPFHFTGDATTYECDGTGANGGTSPVPVVTRGTALAAAIDNGLQASGVWFGGFGPSFNSVNGQNVAYDNATGKYLVEYDNGFYAQTGACADPVVNGEQVLFAYGDGSEMALSLTGPRTVNVGEPAPFVVRNLANNVGQSGAAVGGVTSDANGVATVSFGSAGVYYVKATKPGTIRSNSVVVCVHSGNDGNCGYPLDAPTAPTATPAPAPPPAPVVAPAPPQQADTKAPIARIAGLRNRQHFAHGKGPRKLKGTVTDAGPIKDVELRLSRKHHRRCWTFDGDGERFKRRSCRRGAPWFAIGSDADWSYLLPSRLRPGLYQLQVRATDAAGNRSWVHSLRFRVA